MDPESSTPTERSQVTAEDLRRWAGHWEAVDPGVSDLLVKAASALEARDATIADLRAELKEAKAERVPEELAELAWWVGRGRDEEGLLTKCGLLLSVHTHEDGWNWRVWGDSKEPLARGHELTWQTAKQAALAAAESEGGDYYPDRYNINLNSPSIQERIGRMDPKPPTKADSEEVQP